MAADTTGNDTVSRTSAPRAIPATPKPIKLATQVSLASAASMTSVAAIASALPNVPPSVPSAVQPMAAKAPMPVAAAFEPAVVTPTMPAAADPPSGQAAAPDATPATVADLSEHASTQHNKDIVMTTSEEFMNHGQANFEAVIKAGQIWAAGVQDLGRTLAESAQAQFDHNMATWKALAGIKSVKEAFDIQSTRARTALEKAVADGGKLTDASMKLAEQTMAPITARLTVATDKFARVN